MGTDTNNMQYSGLSYDLLYLGFFPVLGTMESSGGGTKLTLIGRGKPKTFDTNNGTIVVYDELGRPWVTLASDTEAHYLRRLEESYGLRRGAHVPHSNDGGWFLKKIDDL